MWSSISKATQKLMSAKNVIEIESAQVELPTTLQAKVGGFEGLTLTLWLGCGGRFHFMLHRPDDEVFDAGALQRS
jgi:hypothetical protein